VIYTDKTCQREISWYFLGVNCQPGTRGSVFTLKMAVPYVWWKIFFSTHPMSLIFFELTPPDVLRILDTHLDASWHTEKILETPEVDNFTRTLEISERVLSTLRRSSKSMYVDYVLSKIFLSMHSTVLLFSRAHFPKYVEHFEYILWCYPTTRKFFTAILSQNLQPNIRKSLYILSKNFQTRIHIFLKK